MNIAEGFADLRLNTRPGLTEEGFWPSFTDIMSVIVMIFLLAMVILLLKNMELVQQLRATMEAERLAAEAARSSAEEKEFLTLRLEQADKELAQLRLQALQLQSERQAAATQLTERLSDLEALSAERDKLAQTLNETMRQVDVLQAERIRLLARLGQRREQVEQLKAKTQRLTATVEEQQTHLQVLLAERESLRQNAALAQSKVARLEEAIAVLQLAKDTTAAELAELIEAHRQQQRTLELTRAQITDTERMLSGLQGEYSDLKVKYDKLVRPARSTVGKHVVEVRYLKLDGAYRFQIKAPDKPEFTSMPEAELRRTLDELKLRHAPDLYVRVIIPEDSGLFYSEAWRFTTDVLSTYDYYYQGGPPRINPEQ